MYIEEEAVRKHNGCDGREAITEEEEGELRCRVETLVVRGQGESGVEPLHKVR